MRVVAKNEAGYCACVYAEKKEEGLRMTQAHLRNVAAPLITSLVPFSCTLPVTLAYSTCNATTVSQQLLPFNSVATAFLFKLLLATLPNALI